MISLSVISMITAVILWIQHVLSKLIYDARVAGHSIVSVTPFSILLGGKFYSVPLSLSLSLYFFFTIIVGFFYK